MAVNLVRFGKGGLTGWGVARDDGVVALSGSYASTRALIEEGAADWRAKRDAAPDVDDIDILSPITAPARIVCQGANYRQHMIESGVDPDQKRFNMFFEKSDASLTSATGDVRRPAHVKLLDYEIELGLVIGAPITMPLSVNRSNYHELLFGLVLANDVSARDVQIPEIQFFKGKSYRSFCPMGPYLTALEGEDHKYIEALDLKLWVNGALRQADNSANMVNKPAETLTEMSTFTDMDPGDVLLTGTPSGCALRPPKPMMQRVARALFDEATLWRKFKENQAKLPDYLQPGDVMSAEIKSADGRINLGRQENRIVQEAQQ
ncbi:MAG: fumarylacetoacetate hydrolase family protein [Pseudomonadota bacterium]